MVPVDPAAREVPVDPADPVVPADLVVVLAAPEAPEALRAG